MQKIEISHRTIIFTVLFLLGLWFIWSIWHIILQLLIAIIIMSAVTPLVNKVEKIKIFKLSLNRSISIVFLYLIFILILISFVALITQPLVNQTSNLVKQFPVLLEKLGTLGIEQSVIQRQISQLNTLPSDIFKLISNIFSNILGVFVTLVIAFYFLLERENLHKHLTNLFNNPEVEKKAEQMIDHLEYHLGGWVRAEFFLMVIVGFLTYIGLILLNIPYALPLAIIAGLLEIVPNIGPTISAIPAVIVGITISPLVAVGVIALYIVVQILENNFIVPQVMSKVVGVNPLVTIVSLLIGFSLAGITGAILAVPIVLLIKSINESFFSDKLSSKK